MPLNKVNFDILFPDEREKGETPLRQCQLVMLRMLKIFDYLCIKNEIKYFLTGGSLIGAVRHQGFIPWDDDLDVGMTRDNYEKFVSTVVPELPRDIFFQSHETDDHYPPAYYVEARLRDKYSSYHHIGKENNKWHEGFQVDLFVYDKSFIGSNFFIIAQNTILKLFRKSDKRVNILKWISKHSPFTLVYSSSYLQHLGLLNLGTYIKHSEYENLIRTKFEDTEVYIPGGYDTYLRRQFGNYMELPNAENRIANHNVVPKPFTPCQHNQILYWRDKSK